MNTVQSNGIKIKNDYQLKNPSIQLLADTVTAQSPLQLLHAASPLTKPDQACRDLWRRG
jgi:hypothetical protein